MNAIKTNTNNIYLYFDKIPFKKKKKTNLKFHEQATILVHA